MYGVNMTYKSLINCRESRVRSRGRVSNVKDQNIYKGLYVFSYRSGDTVFFLIFPMQSTLDKLKFRFITLTGNRQGVHSACQEENYRHKKYIVFCQKSKRATSLYILCPYSKMQRCWVLLCQVHFNSME